jgi:hypothetical protein
LLHYGLLTASRHSVEAAERWTRWPEGSGEFVSGVLRKSGKATRTCNRPQFAIELAEGNPWAGQGDFSKRAKVSSGKRPCPRMNF